MTTETDADLPEGVRVDRPEMPAGYGLENAEPSLIGWSWVSERLEESRNYWLGTTYPDGRPHASPVWGVWLETTLYFGMGPSTRKGKNVARDPRAVLHLESGDEVVIVEGDVAVVSDDELVERIGDVYELKYGLRPPSDPEASLLYGLRPRKVLAWREQDFPSSATRFRFGG